MAHCGANSVGVSSPWAECHPPKQKLSTIPNMWPANRPAHRTPGVHETRDASVLPLPLDGLESVWVAVVCEQLCDVAFSFSFDVGSGCIERPSEGVVVGLSAVEVVVEGGDQVSQSGVFVGEVVSLGVIELSGQVVDARFALFDGGAQGFCEGFGV